MAEDEVVNETPVIEVMVDVQPPVVVTPEPVVPKPDIDVLYKLTVYTSNGTLKSNINNGAFMDMGRRHGDIIRSISSSRWVSLDEICLTLWNYEKKMQHPSNRSKKSILDGLNELVENSFLKRY
jgi:hypothetical protein